MHYWSSFFHINLLFYISKCLYTIIEFYYLFKCSVSIVFLESYIMLCFLLYFIRRWVILFNHILLIISEKTLVSVDQISGVVFIKILV